jgi:hypothetical protein
MVEVRTLKVVRRVDKESHVLISARPLLALLRPPDTYRETTAIEDKADITPIQVVRQLLARS